MKSNISTFLLIAATASTAFAGVIPLRANGLVVRAPGGPEPKQDPMTGEPGEAKASDAEQPPDAKAPPEADGSPDEQGPEQDQQKEQHFTDGKNHESEVAGATFCIPMLCADALGQATEDTIKCLVDANAMEDNPERPKCLADKVFPKSHGMELPSQCLVCIETLRKHKLVELKDDGMTDTALIRGAKVNDDNSISVKWDEEGGQEGQNSSQANQGEQDAQETPGDKKKEGDDIKEPEPNKKESPDAEAKPEKGEKEGGQ